MDFQDALQRRGEPMAGAADVRRARTHRRAADARWRRALREALARQKSLPVAAPDATQPSAVPRLRVVRDDRP